MRAFHQTRDENLFPVKGKKNARKKEKKEKQKENKVF